MIKYYKAEDVIRAIAEYLAWNDNRINRGKNDSIDNWEEWIENAEDFVYDLPTIEVGERTGWIPVSEPPKDGRNVFLAHGTNDFKSCCIGHYDHSMEIWYEDKNFFATPIYDCKYWCDIPELPDMGDSQFDPYKGGDTE